MKKVGNHCSKQKNLEGTFAQCLAAVKVLYYMPIACQSMVANCGANTHRLV